MLRYDFTLHRGYWEAKDSTDRLDAEIGKKLTLDYPLSNTIFEVTATAKMHGMEIALSSRNVPRVEVVAPIRIFDILDQATTKSAFGGAIQRKIDPLAGRSE